MMKRYILGLMAGLMTVITGILILSFVVPFILTSIYKDSDAWLLWFPFVVFPPAFVFGGFAASYVASMRRFDLGFLVGAVAFSVGTVFVSVSGQIWFLFLLVVGAGLLGGVGATFINPRKAHPVGRQ